MKPGENRVAGEFIPAGRPSAKQGSATQGHGVRAKLDLRVLSVREPSEEEACDEFLSR